MTVNLLFQLFYFEIFLNKISDPPNPQNPFPFNPQQNDSRAALQCLLRNFSCAHQPISGKEKVPISG
jgi:hypothetical protein